MIKVDHITVSQESHHGEPVGELYWAPQLCMMGSGPRQAFPEKAIQLKGRHEK